MSELEKILMERDDLSAIDAMQIVNGFREAIRNGDMTPDEALDELGLEPDYIIDLI